jgi:hypothetical protein
MICASLTSSNQNQVDKTACFLPHRPASYISSPFLTSDACIQLCLSQHQFIALEIQYHISSVPVIRSSLISVRSESSTLRNSPPAGCRQPLPLAVDKRFEQIRANPQRTAENSMFRRLDVVCVQRLKLRTTWRTRLLKSPTLPHQRLAASPTFVIGVATARHPTRQTHHAKLVVVLLSMAVKASASAAGLLSALMRGRKPRAQRPNDCNPARWPSSRRYGRARTGRSDDLLESPSTHPERDPPIR